MEDNELIYLSLEIKNDWAKRILYEKYKIIMENFSKRVYLSFFAVPLESCDLASVIYLNFYHCFENYQPVKNKSFKNFLFTNLKWTILKYLNKYTTFNHQIINMANRYEDFHCNTSFKYLNKHTMKITDLNLNLSIIEQNVLQLKHQGFTNFEIMKKLSLTYKQVDNATQRVVMKVKKSKIY